MLVILATVLSLAFQAPAPAYVRGDIVELVRAPGDSPLPDVRIIAVPGDRLQADRRGILVNEQTVEGLSKQLLEQFAEAWDQVVPTGHYFVIAETEKVSTNASSSVRFHGLIPADRIIRKTAR